MEQPVGENARASRSRRPCCRIGRSTCLAIGFEWVNTPITAKELDRLKLSLERGRPFGSDRWVMRTAEKLKLEHTLRREGRPSEQPSDRKNVSLRRAP